MNQHGGEPRSDKNDIVAVEEIKRLSAAFSQTSAIAFAICDNQMRYRSINTALAALNGLSVEAHLGNTSREVLGQVGEAVEAALTQVLVTGEAVSKEIAGELPTRKGPGHWIVTYFPVKQPINSVQCLGGIGVETTELKKMHQLCSKLMEGSVQAKDQQRFWRARELQDSITRYFTALTMSLDDMTHLIWQPDKSADEHLAPAIELLDQRIVAMRKLVSAVASRVPIDQQR